MHGLTTEFLADKPPFDHVADDFLAFVGDAPQHDDMTMILLKVDEVAEAVA